jgi:hypothetical protein
MCLICRAKKNKNENKNKNKPIKEDGDEFQSLNDLSIEELDCEHCNELTTIPSNLINLKRLWCNDCPRLKKIPPTLVSLTLLNCSNTPIKNIPPTLVSLTLLKCSNTPIKNIPKCFVDLKDLNCWNCSYVKKLSSYPKLEYLDAGGCSNLTLIKKIPQIKYLDTSFCRFLRKVPHKIKTLEYARLNRTPLLYVPFHYLTLEGNLAAYCKPTRLLGTKINAIIAKRLKKIQVLKVTHALAKKIIHVDQTYLVNPLILAHTLFLYI